MEKGIFRILNKSREPFPFQTPVNWNRSKLEQVWEVKYHQWWRKKYSRYVPKDWMSNGSVRPIVNCLLKASEENPLSKKQIEAAINFPDSNVTLVVSKNLKLSPEQLALVLSHPVVSRKNIGDLHEYFAAPAIDAQKKKGMTDEDIEKAKKIARDILSKRTILALK